MIRILFLDDDPDRRAEVEARIFHDFDISALLIETPEEAIAALSSRKFDIVSLDHDLYGKVYQPSDERSGWAVCQHISKMPKAFLPEAVICHSFNPDGVKEMIRELRSNRDLEIEPIPARFGTDLFWRSLFGGQQ